MKEKIVEIGFGQGDFLAEQARSHPENIYIGFEVPSLLTNAIEKPKLPNLYFSYSGGVEGLSKLKKSSVSTVIMHFVLDDDFTITKWQQYIDSGIYSEQRYSKLENRQKDKEINDLFDQDRNNLLSSVRRVLCDDGRLHIYTFEHNLSRTKKYLERAGFEYEFKKSTNEEISQSQHMREVVAKTATRDPFYRGSTIYTIIAKKDLPQRLLPSK